MLDWTSKTTSVPRSTSMTRLLHVSASPRGAASDPLTLAGAFLDAHQAVHPGVHVSHLDLHDGTLPAFGRLHAGAKMAVTRGGQPSPEQTGAWDEARAVFDRFVTADAYLFSVPMWNSGVPYVLKQWIDIITQPGWVFGFTPAEGYTGLLTGKKAAVVYTSGVYSPGAPPAFGVDFHASYLNDWLRFAGFTDVTEIRFQPTELTATPDQDRAAAVARAADAGKPSSPQEAAPCPRTARIPPAARPRPASCRRPPAAGRPRSARPKRLPRLLTRTPVARSPTVSANEGAPWRRNPATPAPPTPARPVRPGQRPPLMARAPWCTALDTGERRCLLGLMRKMLRSRGGR